MLRVTPQIVIDESELEERFVRASGPGGGQNVNKVATAVELRFNAARSPAIDDEVLARLRVLAGNRMTAEGVIAIDARTHRTQARNREDARERLAALIRRAAVRQKRRKATQPTAISRLKRIETKRRRSAAKRQRTRVTGED